MADFDDEIEDGMEPNDDHESGHEDSDINTSNQAEEAGKSPNRSEAEIEAEITERIAKRSGWAPQSEWKRDPTKWVDAATFLEQTPSQLQAEKDKRRRLSQAYEAAVQDATARAKLEAENEVRRAVALGDQDAAVAALARVQQVSQPPDPRGQVWAEKNASWFNRDPEATQLAESVYQSAVKAGHPITDALEQVDRIVQRAYPQYAPAAPVTRQAPVVQPAQRTGASSRPKEKGWGDISKAERQELMFFVDRQTKKGKSDDKAKELIAKAYWDDKAQRKYDND